MSGCGPWGRRSNERTERNDGTALLRPPPPSTAAAARAARRRCGRSQDGAAGMGLLLTVTVADCIPVYLAAPDKQVVALLHAGWRGTAGGILERGVELVKRMAFVRSGDIVMHCGVGICGECYEVGSEVLSRFSGRAETAPGHVDLRVALAQQGRTLGLGGITLSPWCSAHDRELFFSHRASGGRDGRMIAYAGLPLAAVTS